MSDHSHDYHDILGVAEERHRHHNSDLDNTPSEANLAKIANEVTFLQRQVSELQAQLRAEQIVTRALKQSSLNAESFVHILRLNAASLKEGARRMHSTGTGDSATAMLLAGLLESIAESTESEIPR